MSTSLYNLQALSTTVYTVICGCFLFKLYRGMWNVKLSSLLCRAATCIADLNENALQCVSILCVWSFYCWKKHGPSRSSTFCWKRTRFSYVYVGRGRGIGKFRWKTDCLVSIELCQECVWLRVSILHINRLFNLGSKDKAVNAGKARKSPPRDRYAGLRADKRKMKQKFDRNPE